MIDKNGNPVSIINYLSWIGFKPVTTDEFTALYRSPLSFEKTPNFKVNLLQNTWRDNSLGMGGDLLKLVRRTLDIDESQAIQTVKEQLNAYSPHPPQVYKAVNSAQQKIKILNVQRLRNNRLVGFLERKGIPWETFNKHIEEAYIKVGKKGFYYLALKNDRGGYEFVAPDFAGSSEPNWYTTIPVPGSTCLTIFAGMLDFLSALVYYELPDPRCTTIILNSFSHKNEVELLLKNFKKINLYLNNDPAGEKLSRHLMNQHKNAVDYSKQLYENYPDFNSFLCDYLKKDLTYYIPVRN